MDRFSIGFFSLACVIAASPLTVYGSTCTDTIKNIINAESSNGKQEANWKDFAKLKDSLGTPQKKQVAEQTYTWKWAKGTYTIVLRDGETVDSHGEHPADLGDAEYPSLKRVTNILGKPQSAASQKIMEYSWNCTDTHSELSLYTNEAANITSYYGKFCPTALFADDCSTFSD